MQGFKTLTLASIFVLPMNKNANNRQWFNWHAYVTTTMSKTILKIHFDDTEALYGKYWNEFAKIDNTTFYCC
jgi:hypothetical protein